MTMTSGRVRILEDGVRRVKEDIMSLGNLRPGSLSEQYNVCGKANCRCKANPPKKHGPYYQLSFTWQGRSRTQFVRRPDVPVVKEQIRNFERLRELVDELIGFELELSRIKLDERREQDGSIASRTRA
jgi:hypothetical protein